MLQLRKGEQMEYIIVIVSALVVIILLKHIFGINIKKLKEIAKDEQLDKFVEKFPNNLEVCKEILKIVNNEQVSIKETKEETTMYTVINDTILISEKENNYTRIQTIAHECLHSVQDKKLLLFNFIFSNIYILYFIIISVLTIFKIIQYPNIQIGVLVILGVIYYIVRTCLEEDAMINAKPLAEKYITVVDILMGNEKEILLNKYEQINRIGVKSVKFSIFVSCVNRIIIYSLICFISFYMF